MEIKHFLEKRRNIILGISLLFVGIVLGVGITTYLSLLAGTMNTKLQPQPIKMVDETEIKKQALAKFYNELSTMDKHDWAKMYDYTPQLLKSNLTREQYIKVMLSSDKTQAEKNKIVSEKTIIHSIEVNGNNGTVDRTIVSCLANDCTGNNRKEDHAKKEYEYVNGKWKIPEPKPSAKALEIASYIYVNSNADGQKYLENNYGYGSSSAPFIASNLAQTLDENPDKLALAEAWVDKNKAERNRPVVNYQPPAIIEQPAPVIQEAPIVQQQTFPRNCTSNTIGNYTYTNCY